MQAFSILPGEQFRQEQLRRELESQLDIKRFLKKVDAQPSLIGAKVIYFNGADVLVVREFQPICSIEPITVLIRSVPKHTVSSAEPTNSHLESQNGRVYSALYEATGAAISCGAAVLGWVVVIGSGTAIPVSGGTSTALTVIAGSAALASSAQCLNGVGRTYLAMTDNTQMLSWLDSEEWYQKTSVALDLVSLAGAGGSTFVALKTFKTLKTASSSSLLAALAKLSRPERKRLTEEIIRNLHPGISSRAIKAYIRAGVYPARYSQPAISHALKLELVDAVGATLGYTGSAVSGVLHNPKSQLRTLLFGIYRPVKTL